MSKNSKKKVGSDCPSTPCSRLVWKRCHGPAIRADEEKCASIKADSAGGHMVPNTGDAASYNGIRTWRCHECFEEHRKRIARDKALNTSQTCNPKNLVRVVEAHEAERISSAND